MRTLILLSGFLCAALAACATPPSAGPAPTSTPSPLPKASAIQAPRATLPPESEAVTHTPLTSKAIESCPVTLPNGKSPAEEDGSSFNLGNDKGTIFTIPWPNGTVIFTPNGPGAKEPDGSLGMKWPWYRTVEGDVVITARRLDANAPPPRTVVLRGNEDGYGETGFHPSGLWFSGPGCWEMTATIGSESLTFVTLVVRLDFDPPVFAHWPSDVPRGWGTDLSRWPNAIREISGTPAGGQIIVETFRDAAQPGEQFPVESIRNVSVNDAPAVCAAGARDENGDWNSSADEIHLQWQSSGLTFRLIATGLSYRCDDLLQIANSQL
jgi:hypothetical protein